MKLKDLLDQLNQLAKERPEALEMEVWGSKYLNSKLISSKIDAVELREKIIYIWQE